MKKIYSFLLAAICLLICGNAMAADKPVSGKYYKIKNQQVADRYIGGKGSGNDAVIYVAAATDPDYQVFLVTEQAAGKYSFYQVAADRYMQHDNAYTGSWAAAYSSNRQLFGIDNATSEDYCIIQKVKDDGTFANGIGTDSDNAGSTLFFDKGASDRRNRWLFEEVSETVALDLLKSVLQDKITGATTILNTEGSFGFPLDAKTAFESAINAAQSFYNNIDEETTGAAVMAETLSLNQAINAYLASELKPKLNAVAGKKYYIRSIRPNGQVLQYLKDVQTGRRIEMSNTVNPEGDNYEMWSLEVKEGGKVDEYYVKNVGSGLYLDQWGESLRNLTTDANNVATVVVSYVATISELYYFKFELYNSVGTSVGLWSADGSTKMYRAKTGDNARYFRIEEALSSPAALISLIQSAQALYSADNTASGEEIANGTGAGKYTQAAKDALNTAIGIAQTVYDDSSAEPVDIDNATSALKTAIDAYNISVLANKEALNTAVSAAEFLFSATVVGVEHGNYSQAAADSLSNETNRAKAVKDNLTATQAETNAALAELNLAIAYAQSQIVYIIDLSKSYYIKNTGKDMYLGRADAAETTVVSLYVEKTAETVYTFTLAAVDGEKDVYRIKYTGADQYLSYTGGYNTFLNATQSKVHIIHTGSDLLKLRFIEKTGNNYIGGDTGNAGVWADKTGNDAVHIWVLEADASTGTDNPAEIAFRIFTSERNLNIIGLSAGAKVSVFDITGRKLFSETVLDENYSRALSSAGSYIVSIEQAGQRTSSVLIVK